MENNPTATTTQPPQPPQSKEKFPNMPTNIGTINSIRDIQGVVKEPEHEMLPDLASPRYAFHVANELKKFVIAQQLTVQIQDRPYALVEAWQFTGAQFGLYPILTELKNESTYEAITFEWKDKYNNPRKKNTFKYKYRATVEIRRFKDDKCLSKAELVCTNEEGGKHEFQEYAIQSMAQTRAEGKAWRMLLGWVMKAAGFEATPYEEMDSELQDYLANVPTSDEKKELIKLAWTAKYHDDEKENEAKRIEALATIAGCDNYNLFNRIEARLKALQPSIHEIVNPNQKDINEHLKKSL